MTNKMTVEPGTVKIRMYNTEFGDCFLLGFPTQSGGPKYMLIDFGTHHNTANKTDKLEKIARELNAATEGKIHLLVVTHEHTDHIEGFKRANEIFKQIEVENIWMGWTENYDDPEVKKLDKIKRLYIQALDIAIEKLTPVKPTLANTLTNILRFDIDENHQFDALSYGLGYNPATKKPSTNRQTMIWLKHHCRNVNYCSPGGAPLQCEGIDGVKFYVMGPPTLEQEGRLTKSAPSKGSKKETYLTDQAEDGLLKFAFDLAGLKGNAATDFSDLAVSSEAPFSDKYRCSNSDHSIQKRYESPENEWRGIDDIWLEMAGNLAIKLDSHTNNSSLVLAIELDGNGKILLFPGDAQVGNWLGWGDLTWKNGETEITRDDLLKRTVLYKVGHHGSHNATLKKQGLEKMVDPDLTALIPVDQHFAENQNWEIPYPKLLKRLKTKCRKRVLRSDEDLPVQKPYNVGKTKWNNFLNTIQKDDDEKYIEIIIEK